jgi:hypothetical protein
MGSGKCAVLQQLTRLFHADVQLIILIAVAELIESCMFEGRLRQWSAVTAVARQVRVLTLNGKHCSIKSRGQIVLTHHILRHVDSISTASVLLDTSTAYGNST